MRSGFKLFTVTLALLTMVGCAQGPTKAYESQAIDTMYLERSLKRPIAITEDTLIIDCREPFEYAVAHIPNSIPLSWTDFVDRRGPFPGLLKTDLYAETRRLAIMGISPKTPVVIVGQGLNGNGEEGRLAWTLLYLGVTRVQVSEINALGLRFSNIQTPPRKSETVWEPRLRQSIMSTRNEVVRAATSKFSEKVHIIDVRSKDEYFSKSKKLEYELPDLRAVNVEWKEFFTADGRPRTDIRRQLEAIHIHPEDRVIVISNNGVRSGAVAYALLSLGYKNAANYSGGYTELVNARGRSRR